MSACAAISYHGHERVHRCGSANAWPVVLDGIVTMVVALCPSHQRYFREEYALDGGDSSGALGCITRFKRSMQKEASWQEIH